MNGLLRILQSRYFLWTLLFIPWLLMTVRYLSGSLYYGEFVHVTGEFSARLLIVAMSATPLRLMFPESRWAKWLLRNRRYFGVATFAYALPHLAAYLVKLGSMAKIIEQSAEPGMWTGWIALLIFFVLAITSNNPSTRKLGRRWKQIHRFVYFAAVLTFAHWVLVAFDPIPGLIHASILLALEAYRLAKNARSAPVRMS
jgi:sulfoxide reductase heme-binding subunit YedZ